jgi:hypothetical protein
LHDAKTAFQRRAALSSAGAGSLTPERPRAALRIGVTGHRLSRLKALATEAGGDFASYEAMLADCIEAVLKTIATACHDCRDRPASLFSAHVPLMRVVVGGAFGIDRLAAEVVDERLRGPRGQVPAATPTDTVWRLETVLPAPLTLTAEAAWPDYVDDPAIDKQSGSMLRGYADDWQSLIDRSDSVTELPASWRANGQDAAPPIVEGLADFPPFQVVERPGREFRLSYGEASSFHLQQADLLIAVWDGRPSRGPGGVAENAARALAAGLPVVVINAAQPALPPQMLRSVEFGPDHPNIIGWTPIVLEPVLESADCRDGALADAVRGILEFPQPGVDDDHRHAHSEQPLSIDDFFAESAPVRRRALAYDRFIAVFSGRWPFGARKKFAASVSRAGDAWQAMASDVGDQTQLAADLQGVLKRRYAAASALANFYAAQYRSAFIAAFLLGAIAGGVAVFSQAFNARDWLKVSLIITELVVIFRVFHIVRTGRKRKYHAKYIEYRTLAESLHSLRPLCAFGETPSQAASDAAGGGWYRWYLQATIREMALPDRSLDAGYQRRILKTVARHEIEPEIAYHQRNSKVMMHVDHNIHLVGNYLFFLVILALGALLSLWVYKLAVSHAAENFMASVKPWMTIVAAFFPAAGSALAGIRFMADFDGKAMRSLQMTKTLQLLAQRAENAAEKQDYNATRLVLGDLAVTLSEDVNLFRTTYSRRELVLPS